MSSTRLEAFSDAVIAIVMTIMVLELVAPHEGTWEALVEIGPGFLIYLLSFVFLGIYWNNHHHMIQIVERVNGRIMWANLHLLFWLSLTPFVTAWIGEAGVSRATTATYGIVLLLAAIAYYILQTLILAAHGPDFPLRRALGRDPKGKLSPVLYASAIVLALVDFPWLSLGVYVFVALMWLIPDRRIEALYDSISDG